jgi:hypothetical protein
MSVIHMVALYASLVVLGLSLLIPGVMGVRATPHRHAWACGNHHRCANHARALNGMMAAIGILALWSCSDLPSARPLVLALGVLMVALVVARACSIAIDGMPGAATKRYLAVELVFGIIFLIWAPQTSL